MGDKTKSPKKRTVADRQAMEEESSALSQESNASAGKKEEDVSMTTSDGSESVTKDTNAKADADGGETEATEPVLKQARFLHSVSSSLISSSGLAFTVPNAKQRAEKEKLKKNKDDTTVKLRIVGREQGPDGPVFLLRELPYMDAKGKMVFPRKDITVPLTKLPTGSPWVVFYMQRLDSDRYKEQMTHAHQVNLDLHMGDWSALTKAKGKQTQHGDAESTTDTASASASASASSASASSLASASASEGGKKTTSRGRPQKKVDEDHKSLYQIVRTEKMPIKVDDLRKTLKNFAVGPDLIKATNTWLRQHKFRAKDAIRYLEHVDIPDLRMLMRPALQECPEFYELLPFYPDGVLIELSRDQLSALATVKRSNHMGFHVWEVARHMLPSEGADTGKKYIGLVSLRVPYLPRAARLAIYLIQKIETDYHTRGILEYVPADILESQEHFKLVIEMGYLIEDPARRGHYYIASAYNERQKLEAVVKSRAPESIMLVDSPSWLGEYYGRAVDIAKEHGAVLAADYRTYNHAKDVGEVKDIEYLARAKSGKVVVLRAERLSTKALLEVFEKNPDFVALVGDSRQTLAFERQDAYFFGFAYLIHLMGGPTEVIPYAEAPDVWQRDVFEELVSGYPNKIDVAVRMNAWDKLASVKDLNKINLFLCTTEEQRQEVMQVLSSPGKAVVSDDHFEQNCYYMDETTGFCSTLVQPIKKTSPTVTFDDLLVDIPKTNLRNQRVELITKCTMMPQEHVAFVVDKKTARKDLMVGLKLATTSFRLMFAPGTTGVRLSDLPELGPVRF